MAVKDVFDLTVTQSYLLAARRLEAIESRIQHIMTLAPAILLAVALPTVAIASGDDALRLNWMAYGALSAMGGVTAIGMGVRFLWALHFLSPSGFKQEHLEMDTEAFQANALGWAGKHMALNVKMLNKKSLMADVMSLLLAAEAALAAFWAASVL